jgi:hypothetical protein
MINLKKETNETKQNHYFDHIHTYGLHPILLWRW